MEIINDIVIALLTSSVVSAIVSFVLRWRFETRLKHHYELEMERLKHSYQVELEKLKTELTIDANTVHELTGRRLAAYPKIVELVYRIRNMAREIKDATEPSSVLVDEFAARAHELEDQLYSYRMDLERDHVFIPIHTYKNAAKTFNRLIEDWSHYRSLGESNRAEGIVAQLKALYAEIELQHIPIIENLSHHESLFPSVEG